MCERRGRAWVDQGVRETGRLMIDDLYSRRDWDLLGCQTLMLQFNYPMNHLWSPWRMEYIENNNKDEGCIFCIAQVQEDSAENLIAHRGEHAYVILNRYPYTSGHLMVVPLAHKASLEGLDPQTRAEIMELTTVCMTVLRNVYNPQAFNIGMNIGEAAGAGVKEHVHLHVVPRWRGDTNFISVLGESRVLPELLADTYQRIQRGFQELITQGDR